jgi:hypothetical protein
VTKEHLCRDSGEGFVQLLKHFLVDNEHGRIPLDFPVLSEPRVWRLWGIQAFTASF